MPSVDEAANRLLHELRQPQSRVIDDSALQRDVRRWWSLTLTLVTQRAELATLVRLMGPDWAMEEAKEADSGSERTRLESDDVKERDLDIVIPVVSKA